MSMSQTRLWHLWIMHETKGLFTCPIQSSPTLPLVPFQTSCWDALFEARTTSSQLVSNSSPVTLFMLTTLTTSVLAWETILHALIAVSGSLLPMYSSIALNPTLFAFSDGLSRDTFRTFLCRSLAPPSFASFSITPKCCCIPSL